MTKVRFAGRSIRIPGPKPVRIAAGVLLVFGGMLGFLPVLGFWMIPLGLVVLSVDSFRVRRLRRRFEVWWGRKVNGNGTANGANGNTDDASGSASSSG